jgi:HEAT repeat protein
VIETLMSATSYPGVKGSPKYLLEEIIVRAGAPSEERDGKCLARAMLAYLNNSDDVNQRIFLLRQLAVVGREESVPTLAKLLENDDSAIQQHALRALEKNSSPAAGRVLLEGLATAVQSSWRVALINALGARRDSSAVAALDRLLSDGDRNVSEAAAMALGNIGSTEAATALAAARAKASAGKGPFLFRASLLCADRLTDSGEQAAAGEIYEQVHKQAKKQLFRMAALRGLAITRPHDAVPLVIEALRSSDVRTQAEAARLVLKIPGQEATEAFRKAAAELPPSAQAFLSEALADRESGAR